MGNRESHTPSAETAHRPLGWHTRVCAFAGAIVCSGLAAPALARAADPVGTDEVSGEIQAALAEINGLVPDATARSWTSETATASAPNTAPAEAAPASADGAITNEIAAATGPDLTVPSASGSTSPMESGIAVAPPGAAPMPSERERTQTAGHPGRTYAHARAVARSTFRSSQTARVSSAVSVSSSYSAARAVVTSRTMLVTGSARVTRNARPTHKAPAGVVPQRLPPVPFPPRPDMTSSGQAGGQGSVMPLVLVALAAALGIFAFEVLRRTLPRSAFRKPKRIALPPWRPG